MDELSIPELAKYIGITQQQAEVLTTIQKLENTGEQTSAKNIDEKYRTTHNKIIQKPNLFHIIAQLKEKGLVKHERTAEYQSNLDGIKKALEKEKKTREAEARRFNWLYERTEAVLKKTSHREIPQIRYCSYRERYTLLAKSLKTADTYYTIGKTPNICLTYTVAEKLGKDEYVNTLKEMCFKEGLTVIQLTDLNPKQLISYCVRALGDREKARREAHLILDQLESQIASYENLKIYTLNTPIHPLHLKIQLIERDKPAEFFLNLVTQGRDEEVAERGYLHIKSREAAAYAKEMIEETLTETTLLNEKNVKKTIREVKKAI